MTKDLSLRTFDTSEDSVLGNLDCVANLEVSKLELFAKIL